MILLALTSPVCVLRDKIGGERVDMTFDSWLYTWDDPAGATTSTAAV